MLPVVKWRMMIGKPAGYRYKSPVGVGVGLEGELVEKEDSENRQGDMRWNNGWRL